MKKLWTLLILTSALFGTPAATADDERTVVFYVEKMTCATCPITVRAAMQRVDGVQAVKVDFERKIATVTYDASVTNTNDIGTASTDLGSPATELREDGA